MSDMRCKICDRTREEHKADEDANIIHHTFSRNGEVDIVVPEPTPQPNVPPRAEDAPPSDPILRMVLINAGIITVDQLVNAENTLRATGVIRHEPDAGN